MSINSPAHLISQLPKATAHQPANHAHKPTPHFLILTHCSGHVANFPALTFLPLLPKQTHSGHHRSDIGRQHRAHRVNLP